MKRLIAFALLLNAALLGSGCSKGGGQDTIEAPTLPEGPWEMPCSEAREYPWEAMSCQVMIGDFGAFTWEGVRYTDVVVISVNVADYEYDLHLPNGTIEHATASNRLRRFIYSFDSLGSGSKTFRAYFNYVGDLECYPWEQQFQRECTVNIPRPNEPPPPPPEDPAIQCTYSANQHVANLSVSFGGYEGPFFLRLGNISGLNDDQTARELTGAGEVTVTLDGQQFFYPLGLVARYVFVLSDQLNQTVATCELFAPSGHQEWRAMCGVRQYTRCEATTYLVPQGMEHYLQARHRALWCIEDPQCFENISYDNCVFSEPIRSSYCNPDRSIVLYRGSSERRVYCSAFDLDTYLEEGWVPEWEFTDNREVYHSIWMGICSR